MGLFNFFAKKPIKRTAAKYTTKKFAPSVPIQEKRYYQPDEYYTTKIHEGTPFERKVITFDERKKISIPSEHGLYVAEILLLEYCTYGKYPNPNNGYPGFWWFEYGIRDVGAALKSLENRGFVRLSIPRNSLSNLKVEELKHILQANNAPIEGKKVELIERVKTIVTDEMLVAAGMTLKYELTELGEKELRDNAYIPYMHKNPRKTISNSQFGTDFNVWSVNKALGTGDKSAWKELVGYKENKIESEMAVKNAVSMKTLKNIDPKLFASIKTQDAQITAVQMADAKYRADKDIDWYIAFWENLWSSKGLLFRGAKWTFKLTDLYISAKRYDEAIKSLDYVRKCPFSSDYVEKIKNYESIIHEKQSKANSKLGK